MLFAIAIAPVFGEIQISNWEYSKYSNNNWLSENFSSGWSTGNSPFGTPSYFKVSTNADYKHIYVRKIISLNDSTEGLIKARAENNMKCYANGNLVAETHGNIQKGNQFYNCYLGFFSDTCSGGNTYYYDGYNDQNNFIYVDVSKYLKKGNNVIACEAWVDSKAYYYMYNIYYKNYIDGRLYLDFNFLMLNSSAVLWSKTDKNFYKTEISTSVYRTFTCSSSYGCLNHNTYAVVGAEYWDGPWQWSDLPVSDGSYFKWTNLKCQPGSGCNYIDPIWPYDSTNLYFRKWVWSDSDEIKTLQISDTKLPDCYVNGIKINLTSFNSLYWKYTSDVQLKAGQNLIACKSPTTNVNSFDMRIVNVNGPLAIVSVVNDSEIRAGSETIFTVTLANDSHPETHVALTLEAWGQTEYKQLLTETTSGTAMFAFIPREPGTYDLLVTALDLYDNDQANFSSSFNVALASNEKYGFLPMSGSSDTKGGNRNLLVAALIAATGGAAAAGIYAFKGTSQGFSISRIENSLNRASRAMSTLSYVANADAQANQNSFLATMTQRFDNFKAKFSAIEEEKEKIKQEEKERARRIREIDAKNAVLSYKPPEEKPMTWTEWYAQQGVPMPANRQNPVVFSSSWSAIAEEQKNKAIRKEAKEKYGIKTSSINELINILKKPEPVQMGFGQGIIDISKNIFCWASDGISNIINNVKSDDTAYSVWDASKLYFGKPMSKEEYYSKYPSDIIYENGSYKPASVITMQEFSAGALTQVFGTYFLRWFGSIKLFGKAMPEINIKTVVDSKGRIINFVEGTDSKGLTHIFKNHFDNNIPGKSNFKDFGFKTKESVITAIQNTIKNGNIVAEGPNNAGLPTVVYESQIGGVTIRVIANPATRNLITAYPLN